MFFILYSSPGPGLKIRKELFKCASFVCAWKISQVFRVIDVILNEFVVHSSPNCTFIAGGSTGVAAIVRLPGMQRSKKGKKCMAAQDQRIGAAKDTESVEMGWAGRGRIY
jgi:hypothetical protein